MIIAANNMEFNQLNNQIKSALEDVVIEGCIGQRFIGCGTCGKTITINGTPGNGLGSYLNGGVINVYGNAQDAVGDTMNDGKIVIHGNTGDALGYAMRGGSIFVRGNSGYRTGIHMKEYKDKKPVIVIGGSVGSFLGEYLAGGLIVVLGLDIKNDVVGNFTGTGMHGGKIFIRTDNQLVGLPSQVSADIANQDDLGEISEYIAEFAGYFGLDHRLIMGDRFYVLRPNAKNPYKQLYTPN